MLHDVRKPTAPHSFLVDNQEVLAAIIGEGSHRSIYMNRSECYNETVIAAGTTSGLQVRPHDSVPRFVYRYVQLLYTT